MRRHIIPFIIAVSVLFNSAPGKVTTTSPDGKASMWPVGTPMHDCYLCDATGCQWAACPGGK